MAPSLAQLTLALRHAWSDQTSCWADDWPADNPARGQCVVSSLVVQDYFGGDLVRYAVEGQGIHEKHYCNILPDGTLVDATRSQYGGKIVSFREDPVALNGAESVRHKRLADHETRIRYEVLKQRVAEYLVKAVG